MKAKILLLSAATIFSVCIASGFIHKPAIKPALNSGNGFAVVELFTSEGCSSCPPADAVVAKVAKESTGKPIYILAYHVDYWNSLGWKDVFSSAGYSRRQHQYSNWLHLDGVYTPQVVVNGTTEFVGSEEGTLRTAIHSALQRDAPAQVILSDIKVKDNEVNLRYQTQGHTTGHVLQLAIVQKLAQTKVERGENSGRTLQHVQIVRSLANFQLKQNTGSATIALPKGIALNGMELIIFIQDNLTGAITGAARAAL